MALHPRDAGVSLVELLLGAGLLALAAYAFASMTTIGQRSAGQARTGAGFTDTLSLIGSLLDRPEACSTALNPLNLILAPAGGGLIPAGALAAPVVLPSLGLPGRDLAKLGTGMVSGYEFTRLEIDRVLQEIGTMAHASGATFQGYLVQLRVEGRRVQSPDSGALAARFVVPVFVDPVTNRIRVCDCQECPAP